MASKLRSIAFLLFQIVVTPLYAVAMVATFWLPRIPRYKMAASWCRTNLLGARAICGIRWQVQGLENVPQDTRAHPHIVMSKHSSTWETLALNLYFPPLAFVAKKELLSIPFFGWGFKLASPITIDRKAGTDAMEQIVAQGKDRFAARVLDRRLSRGNAHPRRHPREVQDGRRAARGRDERAGHPGRAQRGLRLAEGPVREAARGHHDDHRRADLARGQGSRLALAGNRELDRSRGRAARRAAMMREDDPATAHLRLDEVNDPRARRRREGHARKITLAGEALDYRLIRARRRTIGMEVDLTGLTVRAPRWVTLSEIEEALFERAQWIVKALAEWRGRRRDVMPREWKSGAPILYRGRELSLEVFPARAHPRSAGPLQPDRAASAGAGRIGGRGAGGQMAARRSVVPRRASRYGLRRADHAFAARAAAVEHAQRMGKLQRARRDSPQLAPRAAAAPARRVRGRARGRAPRRAQPFAAILGAGRDAHSGTRRAAARARRLDGAARGVTRA